MSLPCPRCARDQAPADQCEECGFALVVQGRWRLRALLGQGGMAPVYRVRDLSGQQTAAAKLMRLGSGSSWKARELFERSAAVLSKLDHRGLPTLYDFGQEEDGTLVTVGELFAGSTLHERIVEQHWHPEATTVTAMLRELLLLLRYLHERPQPIIHRDIKPSNIMFRSPLGGDDDLRPVLVDFDTVAGLAAKSSTTIVVSPGYTAPEQLAGVVAPSADLYSVGATFLLVVSGREPHEFERNRRGALELGSALEHTPARLRRVLEGLLRADPDERFPSAGAALDALDDHDEAPATSVTRVGSPDEGRVAVRRALAIAVGASVTAGVLALMFALVLSGRSPDTSEERDQPVSEQGVAAAPAPPPQPARRPGPTIPANDADTIDAADAGTIELACPPCEPDQICDRGQCETPVATLLSSYTHLTCEITTAQRLQCKARSNRHGELGNGTDDTSGWVRPRGLEQVKYARVGNGQVCAVDEQGTLWCWGDNRYGFIPEQGGASVPLPTVVEAPGEVLAIGLAWARPYVLTQDQRLWSRRDGSPWRRITTKSAKSFIAVDAEGALGVALDTKGQVWRWDHEPNELTRVNPLVSVTAIAVGDTHACALDQAKDVWCWGDNDKGQVGAEDPRHQATPVRVALPGPVRTIDAAGPRSCALLDDRRVRCWGLLGSTQHVPLPVELPASDVMALHRQAVCVIDERHIRRCHPLSDRP